MPQIVEKGRFAPTPSGRMHLGNVFSALLAWLSAQSAGGQMLLRIEDLDPRRTRPAYTRQLLDDLRWLGLDWQEGPRDETPDARWFQSRRTAFYEEQLGLLAESARLYPCFCSRTQLHAASAPHQSDGSYVYSGRCRALRPADIAAKTRLRPPALRLAVPQQTVVFTDGCQGPHQEDLAAACGDFILRRSDGVFAYQLAAPADDGAMGVTQVVRGRDLLGSTARQIWLLQTLGYAPPTYFHHPLLLAPDGRRLAKRDRDLDLGALRAAHTGPEKMLGVLACLAGILPKPQPMPALQLVPLFHWSKVPKQDIVLPPDFIGTLLG